ncbi:MAG: glycosyltransferase family 4 protein [Planctomycetes bacterium]|nr:glycosyltransferase family 4 protein [Planctomycetota bacterium]
MVAALRDRGVTVHIVYKGNHNPDGATYESFAVPGLSLGNAHRRSIRRLRYLSKFFKEHDLVSVFYLSDWGFYDEAIAEGRLALWPWGSDICPPPGAPQETPRLRSRRQDMFHGAHAIASCSHWFADQIGNYAGIETDRVGVVPLGVDLDLFKPAAQPVSEPIVGFLKGFGPAYGARGLIEAMPEIVAQCPDARFDMVGSGGGLQSCRQLANELNVSDRIRWISPVPHERVQQLLQRWCVSVIPSVVESFGVAALESSACGVPVVATRVGGLPETVIDGQTGILTTPDDCSSLARAVVTLLNDADHRLEMGRVGRDFVANRFEWNSCVDSWLSFFEDAASGGLDLASPANTGAAVQKTLRHSL